MSSGRAGAATETMASHAHVASTVIQMSATPPGSDDRAPPAMKATMITTPAILDQIARRTWRRLSHDPAMERGADRVSVVTGGGADRG